MWFQNTISDLFEEPSGLDTLAQEKQMAAVEKRKPAAAPAVGATKEMTDADLEQVSKTISFKFFSKKNT